MKGKKLSVIGGGAAGIMAAISAKTHHPDLEVIILEHNNTLGKKLLVSGASRCNLTNSNLSPDYFSSSSKAFIQEMLDQFGYRQIIDFFRSIGIETYEEYKNQKTQGKIYPITNQASTVQKLLLNHLDLLGVNIRTDTKVENIEKVSDNFKIRTNISSIPADFIIVASGGLSYPVLGATDIGYKIASSFGHSITKPVPSAVPLKTNDWLAKRLDGQRVQVRATSYIEGKKVKTVEDEILFTSYGVSGPAVLKLSTDFSVALNRNHSSMCGLRINLLPDFPDVKSLLSERIKAGKNRPIVNSLYGLLPNKVAEKILVYLKIDLNKASSQLSSEEFERLFVILTKWIFEIRGTQSGDMAEFTYGGINLSEVNAKTLRSKIVEGLYFAGEILDVNGEIGGYNLSWAWSSGWVAGSLN